MARFFRPVFWLSLVLVAVSCQREARPLRYGEDSCAYCRMLLADNHYGAELVTSKGKIYPYDAIECLAADIKRNPELAENSRQFVTDFGHPDVLIPLGNAIFLHCQKLHSPMGLNLSAFAERALAENTALLFYGKEINWQGILDLVRERGF